MTKESPKTSFYKHTEFLSGPDFNANSNVPGFSVRYNQPFFKHGQFRHHFRSDFLNVLLILKGEITFSLNLEKYTAKKDSLIIVSPYTIKKVDKVSEDNLVSGVNFTLDFLTAIGMPKIAVELPDYFSSQFSPQWELKRKDAATSKYRKVVFSEAIDQTLKEICLEISKRYEIYFLEIGTDNDHVHFLIQSVPTYSATKIVTTVKSITAREIFKLHPEVKKQLWGGEFWIDGYFVNTVSKFGDENTITQYVREQGKSKEYKQIHKSDQLKLF